MSTISPNMNLPISTVAVDSGLNWENNLNSSLTLIDLHDHTSGKGVQLTPSSLNINADLPLGNNNLTMVRSVRFQSQPSALALVTDIGCLYESGVDLYYNDGSGNQIRITSGGSIVGAAGTITGLPSGTASAAFAAGVFTFQASTNTGANIDGASHIFRNNTANSKGLTLSPPNAMAADYTLVLPSIPVATSFLQIDTSGNITSTPALLGALTTANLSASAGILGSQLANLTINTAQIAAGAITSAKLATNIEISGNLTVDGLLIPTGNINSATAIVSVATVNATSFVTAKNGNRVPVNANNSANTMSIARGTFNSAGTGVVGVDMTCSHLSTGVYQVNYNTAFSAQPTVVAMSNQSNSICQNSSSIAAHCTILINDTSGNPIDSGFEIIAIGFV